MRRFAAFILCVLLSCLVSGCTFSVEDVLQDAGVDVSEPVFSENVFPGQTASETLERSDDILDQIGDWSFWDVDAPYMADPEQVTVTVSDGLVVTQTDTGFDYSISAIRDRLTGDDVLSDRYVFADVISEEHYSNILEASGAYTSYLVTASVNGILRESHTEFSADYSDLYVALFQDFSAFHNPNQIIAELYVDDLTADTQADVYDIIAKAFGPDFAAYFVCHADDDGVDSEEGLAVTAGNFDDTVFVTVGEDTFTYRFSRTIESQDDGYRVRFFGEMTDYPSYSNFIYFSDNYVEAYDASPVKLSDVLPDGQFSDYESIVFYTAFEDYFSTFALTPTGYVRTLPSYVTYYEMHAQDDVSVYSTQMSLYGVGETVSDETDEVRRIDAAYLISMDGSEVVDRVVYLAGQTTVRQYEGAVSQADAEVFYEEARESIRYFFGQDIVFEDTDSIDVETGIPFQFTADVYGKDTVVTGVMNLVNTDGQVWVDWTVSVS